MTTTEQILDGAGQILSDPNRWYQGYYWNTTQTAWCALGAIGRMYKESGVQHDPRANSTNPAIRALKSVLLERYPELGKHHVPDANIIATWNDDEIRQHSEIVEIFEKARAFAAEKGL